jgi:GTP-binding protein
MKSKIRHDIRNIAIIAHVDHGKTTLVDEMLKQSKIFRENQEVGELIMDSNALEREKGITILAKNTSVRYGETTLNIIDTPGHADFGGEVERVLSMADGCLLLVDSVEGVMPQSRFVLGKALAAGLRTILVINKLDRPHADSQKALNDAYDLFLELAEDPEQLDIPVVYCIGREGRAGVTPEQLSENLQPLFEAIVNQVPGPLIEEGAFQMLVSNLDYDDFTGRQAIGRIFRGQIQPGDTVAVLQEEGVVKRAKIGKVLLFEGLSKRSVDVALAGDIVILSGVENINIGDSLTDPDNLDPLPRIQIEEPTVQITIGVNTSPFSGKEGKYSTSRQIRARLWKELEVNLGLRVTDTESADVFLVSGRGELHLAVLIETIRREGYEFQVSRPQVILKTIDGKKMEPMEHLTVDVQEDYVGAVTELLGQRRGEMVEINYDHKGAVRLEYRIPTRGLIGLRNTFLTVTAGTGVMGSILLGYRPWAGDFSNSRNGVLTSAIAGTAMAYGIANAQERGSTFIEPTEQVYEGMIIGLQKRPGDIAINICKEKQKTNIRSSTSDIAVRLSPATKMSLEQCLDFLVDDELLEVTPENLRLRKRHLTEQERSRARRNTA